MIRPRVVSMTSLRKRGQRSRKRIKDEIVIAAGMEGNKNQTRSRRGMTASVETVKGVN